MSNGPNTPELPPKGLNKKLILGIAGIIALAIIVVLAIFIPKSANAQKVSKQLSLGEKYLSELNYEQAIAAYELAIQIDPKNEDAYIGLAEVYIAMGDLDKAEKVLKDAEGKTGGTEEIRKKLKEIEEKRNVNAPTPEPTPTPEATLTSKPTITPTLEPTVTPTPALVDYVLDWKDEKLEKAMREITKIYDRDIMLSDVIEIKFLYLRNEGIKDISALAELKNIICLNLSDNNISDISALAELKNIEALYLEDNNISNISALAGMENIDTLSLKNNDISNFDVLMGLQHLRDLDLSGNPTKHLEVIKDMTNLEYIFLGASSWTYPSTNEVETVKTNYQGEMLESLDVFANLKNLRGLHVVGMNVRDISGLSELTELEFLNLNCNKVDDISTLAGLKNIVYLLLIGNNISDISVLGELTKLESLSLRCNQITDFSAVEFVPNLER